MSNHDSDEKRVAHVRYSKIVIMDCCGWCRFVFCGVTALMRIQDEIFLTLVPGKLQGAYAGRDVLDKVG